MARALSHPSAERGMPIFWLTSITTAESRACPRLQEVRAALGVRAAGRSLISGGLGPGPCSSAVMHWAHHRDGDAKSSHPSHRAASTRWRSWWRCPCRWRHLQVSSFLTPHGQHRPAHLVTKPFSTHWKKSPASLGAKGCRRSEGILHEAQRSPSSAGHCWGGSSSVPVRRRRHRPRIHHQDAAHRQAGVAQQPASDELQASRRSPSFVGDAVAKDGVSRPGCQLQARGGWSRCRPSCSTPPERRSRPRSVKKNIIYRIDDQERSSPNVVSQACRSSSRDTGPL